MTSAAADIAAQLEEVARIVDLDGTGGPSVDGRRSPHPTTSIVDTVADLLYGDWYLQSSPAAPPTGPVTACEYQLPQVLRAAHVGTERFAGGWRAAQVSTHGRVRATSGDTTRLLERADYVVPARPGLRAEPGDALLVCRRQDHLDQQGFWTTHTDSWPPAPDTVVVRLYWHVTPAGAPPLVRRLSRLLLDGGTAAAVKVLADRGAFGRADAAVLYLPRESFPALADGVHTVAAGLDRHLHDPPPRLSRRLGLGLGAAETALEGPSFGQLRCRLIAEALVAAHGAGVTDVDGRVAAIRDRFVAAGLDPDRPHLAPSSITGIDPYER